MGLTIAECHENREEIIRLNIGLARTLDPTIKNCTPDARHFDVIAGVNPAEVQWPGLTLGTTRS